MTSPWSVAMPVSGIYLLRLFSSSSSMPLQALLHVLQYSRIRFLPVVSASLFEAWKKETYCLLIRSYRSQRQTHYIRTFFRWESVSRDFEQRQRGRRRERHKIRETPKGPLHITGGKQVDVLCSGPTWVKLNSRCLETWVFAFVSSAVSTLNNPCY